MKRFTENHETRSSYFFLGGKYYKASELGAKKIPGGHFPPDEKKLLEVYKLFDIRKPPLNISTGRLLNPFDIHDEIAGSGLDELEKRKPFCGQDK